LPQSSFTGALSPTIKIPVGSLSDAKASGFTLHHLNELFVANLDELVGRHLVELAGRFDPRLNGFCRPLL
jgi:hypothetical protein